MAYSDSATLAIDATFLGRLRVALNKKALTQLGLTNDGSPRFEKRARLAIRVLTDPDVVVEPGGSASTPTVRAPLVIQQFAWALVAANPGWTAAPNDNTLDTGITAAVIDAVAGVFSTD